MEFNTKIKQAGALFSAIALGLNLLFSSPVLAAEETTETTTETVLPQISTNEIPGWPQGPDISSDAGILLETSTDTVLYGKNMDSPLFPGSTVKIMTVLLTLENCNLTDEVTMTETGVMGITDGGVSISAQLGEVFTAEQCVYAVMLASANDIALQLAEHVGGSVDEFVSMMNSRAAELGCTNTVFTNPTGLPDDNQHTTAHDMALIMQAAYANETFQTILQAQSYTIPATNVSGGERALTNSFDMTNSQSTAYYADCIGGKKGFTNASGETLVCVAQQNDLTLICVILKGASGATAGDAGTLLDYGFGQFQLLDLGRDDFDVLEGGIVLAPLGATADSFTIQDTEAEDGTISRVYQFGGTNVGTATCSNSQEEDTSSIIDGEANLKEAQEFSQNQSIAPYLMIGGVGALLLILLLICIIKVMKS
jgi:D-alanyl-D-alanine carboxypeptidase